MANNRRLPILFGMFLSLLFAVACIYISGSAVDADAAGDMEIIRERMLRPYRNPVDTNRILLLLDPIRPDGSWPEVDYHDLDRANWKTTGHLSNLLTMTEAYTAQSSELRGNPDLSKAIHLSLDYWLDNDFLNPNWWFNDIGVPRTLAPILLMLDDELTDKQRAGGIKILTRGKLGMTGQNLVWVAEITVQRGLVERNPALVAEAFSRIADEITISMEEGIQPDYSFHQHGPLLYSHGYGAGFVTDCTRIANMTSGTMFAFPEEKISILTSLILDGHQWMTRGNASDFGAEGREITRKSQNASHVAAAARNLLNLTFGRESELKSLIARAEGDLSVPLSGNRHFWRSDIMTHHRKGYYASARMYSSRTFNTELVNNEGLKSHHIADGCTVIMRSGGEYDNIFAVWDWQRIPGTTVELTPELSGELQRHQQSAFVGGVSDGTYGMAAFDFERDGLCARKSWFFFDNEYVCLGAGISCSSDNPVVTTVNQCRSSGEVTLSENNAQRQLKDGVTISRNADWVHHDDVAYIFPEQTEIELFSGVQKGNWREISHSYSTDTVAIEAFTLTLKHGGNPSGGNYAYIVAPGMELSDTAGYAANTGIEILVNEPDLQAVRNEALKITGIAFYRPATVRISDSLNVNVDKSCLVLIRETSGALEISVSNPENVKSDVTVTINNNQTEVFELPDGMFAGMSITKMVPISYK